MRKSRKIDLLQFAAERIRENEALADALSGCFKESRARQILMRLEKMATVKAKRLRRLPKEKALRLLSREIEALIKPYLKN